MTNRSLIGGSLGGGNSGGPRLVVSNPAGLVGDAAKDHAATSANLRPAPRDLKAKAVTYGPADGCRDCAALGEACERHLRGLALVDLDRARWPRLRLKNGAAVVGDDAWRPWLREANAEQLRDVLALLSQRR